MNTYRTFAAALVAVVTGGRIITPAARREIVARRRAWSDHAAAIQSELDAERARGWGFRYCDGRRVDF